LFDRRIPGWREDNLMLRYALGISLAEIWDAHIQAKRAFLARVNSETQVEMDEDVFTLGFARRATPYKRADLLFHDLEQLKAIVGRAGKLQIIYAGKAHPNDKGGKELIQRVFEARNALRDSIKLVYLPNYDWRLGQLITAGVDVWLNTPQPPMEASGTSGMKAAVNGVPSLSVLDGWWIEGCIEGVSGWSIEHTEEGDSTAHDSNSLYDKLERVVLPLYYRDRDSFVEVMRYAIALNGSFFNTQRMVTQYVAKAYFA
jgi:starch phosphorylase